MNRIGIMVVGGLLAALVMATTLFVVDQRQYAVVYALGEIKTVISEPGLKFKLPAPFQNVVFIDRRTQTLDSLEPKPMYTAEKKSLVIDWLLKWRITDPRQFILNSTGSGGIRNDDLLSNAESRLTSIIQAALNEEVNKRTVAGVLSTEREKIMRGVIQRLSRDDDVKAFGIEIVDVRIKRVDFSANITDAVYRRMESERKRVANELRSQGVAEGEKIRADADRQREVIVAEAYRDAQKIKGEGDAKASALYSESFGKDPQFAQFYRNLDALRSSFASKNDVMVVDPSSDFFKAMRGTGAAAAPRR